MIIQKHTWVCSICASGFTRKPTASRHNSNLHSGGAMLVRPLEYIIGRLEGKFHPGIDPLLFRRRNIKRSQNTDASGAVFSHEDNDNSFGPKTILDIRHDPINHSDITQPTMNDNNSRRPYHDFDSTERQLDEARKKQFDSNEESQETLSSKFEKIKKMATPYFSSESVDIILANLAQRVLHNDGNDSSVDEYIAELRKKVNQMEAIDRLFPSKRPKSRIDISEQQMQQGSANNSSFRDIPEAASIKLAEIEQVLTPYCPPESVRKVIAGLTEKCIMTRDYSFLDSALERHRRNAEGYARRY